MAKGLNLLKYKKIHFVGVGGISMSALAKYAIARKKMVSGSDGRLSSQTDELQSNGVKIYLGHHESAVKGKDLVVYTSAVNKNNPELISAKRQNIPIAKRSEFLGEILSRYKNSIAVSGCHGKTTATAMLSNILVEAGLDPTVFLGGEVSGYGNFRLGKMQYVVVEACEYKKNFLDMPHTVSIVLNVDKDHLDSFNGMSDLIDAFNAFIGDTFAIINADDANAKNIFNKTTVTFGLKTQAMFRAKNIRQKGKRYSFDFTAYSQKIGRINLNVLGKFNVYNALATATVCFCLGIDFLYIKRGLEKFKGVKRRNEILSEKGNTKFIADYAHHPKELMETGEALEVFGENSLIIFQPHTYSRTKTLMKDFVQVLSLAKNLIIYKTYSARESFDYSGSAKRLYQLLKEINSQVEYADNPNELNDKLQNRYKQMDKVVFFGAGDIYEIAIKAIKNLDG